MPERGTNIGPQKATTSQCIVHNTTAPHLFWGSLVALLGSSCWSLFGVRIAIAYTGQRHTLGHQNATLSLLWECLSFCSDDRTVSEWWWWWAADMYRGRLVVRLRVSVGLRADAVRTQFVYLDIENGRFRCAGWWLAWAKRSQERWAKTDLCGPIGRDNDRNWSECVFFVLFNFRNKEIFSKAWVRYNNYEQADGKGTIWEFRSFLYKFQRFRKKYKCKLSKSGNGIPLRLYWKSRYLIFWR